MFEVTAGVKAMATEAIEIMEAAGEGQSSPRYRMIQTLTTAEYGTPVNELAYQMAVDVIDAQKALSQQNPFEGLA